MVNRRESERRTNERHQLVFHIEVIDAGSEASLGYLVDISTEGLMLASEAPLKSEHRYRMRLPLPVVFDGYDRLDVEATVAWTAPSMNPAFYRTGFRELQLVSGPNDALRRLIDDYHLQTL